MTAQRYWYDAETFLFLTYDDYNEQAHPGEYVSAADFDRVVQERDTLARRVAELEQALTASAQFLYPGVDRGPAINGWANTVEMVEKSVPAPPVRD